MQRYPKGLLGRAIRRSDDLRLVHAVTWIITTFLVCASETVAYGQGRRPLEILHEEFQRRATRTDTDHTALLWGLAIFVGLVVVLAMISGLVNFFQQHRPYFSHTLLFLELSRVHRMRLKDISLLWKWTSRDKIRPRSLIFVDPGLWQNKIDRDLLAAGPIAVQTDWNRLYVQLFGTFVPHPNPSVSFGQTTTEPTNSCEN